MLAAGKLTLPKRIDEEAAEKILLFMKKDNKFSLGVTKAPPCRRTCR